MSFYISFFVIDLKIYQLGINRSLVIVKFGMIDLYRNIVKYMKQGYSSRVTVAGEKDNIDHAEEKDNIDKSPTQGRHSLNMHVWRNQNKAVRGGEEKKKKNEGGVPFILV